MVFVHLQFPAGEKIEIGLVGYLIARLARIEAGIFCFPHGVAIGELSEVSRISVELLEMLLFGLRLLLLAVIDILAQFLEHSLPIGLVRRR